MLPAHRATISTEIRDDNLNFDRSQMSKPQRVARNATLYWCKLFLVDVRREDLIDN
jgi:hypothetical protein